MEEQKDNTNYNHTNPSDREAFRLKDDTVGIKEELDYAITLIKHYTKDTYKKGATIAVHAHYGGGKTFFATKLEDKIKEIKLDDKEDKNITYTPIYIDMWQNDYKDPLLVISESLFPYLETNSLDKLDNFRNLVAKILPIINGVGFAGANISLDTEYLANLIKTNKESIEELKNILSETTKKQKLVFLIDEIDRCNPDFAITMLERIKHFFNIDNIVFVLFINQMYVQNLEQKYLGHGVDTNSYMAKFIDKAIYLKNDLSKKTLIDTLTFCNTVNNDVAAQLLIIADYFNLSLRELIQIDNDIEVLFTMKDDLYDNKEGLVIAFFMYALKRKEFDNFKEIVENKKLFKIKQVAFEAQEVMDYITLSHPDNQNKENNEKRTEIFNNNNLIGKSFYNKLDDYYELPDLQSLIDLLIKITETNNLNYFTKIIAKKDKIIEGDNHIINQYLRDLCL
jgi:hypothetical protein